MYTLAKWLYLLALIVWLGAIIFFSFVVAPSMFRIFPIHEAGRAVAAVFPTYYGVGYVCGVLLLMTSVIFLSYGTSRLWWGLSTVLAAGMLAATVYAGAVVLPRADALRLQIDRANTPPAVQSEFDRLHKLAVTLNGAVLLCGLVLSVGTATRLRP